jgi:NADH-quinone oxidoreductase subunit N
MLSGNFLALLENDLKRILAFSSIAHFGYFLIALLNPTLFGTVSLVFYLAAYSATLVLAFGVIASAAKGGEAQTIEDIRGLAFRRPVSAVMLAAALLSLAGIPLTAGFIGKFYIFAAGVEARAWILCTTLVVSSTIGLFYYLRVAQALFSEPADGIGIPSAPARTNFAGDLVQTVAFVTIVWFGVYPGPLTLLFNWLLVS